MHWLQPACVAMLWAASSTFMANAALAQTIALPPPYLGSVYGGTSTLDLGSEGLAALDTMKMSPPWPSMPHMPSGA